MLCCVNFVKLLFFFLLLKCDSYCFVRNFFKSFAWKNYILFMVFFFGALQNKIKFWSCLLFIKAKLSLILHSFSSNIYPNLWRETIFELPLDELFPALNRFLLGWRSWKLPNRIKTDFKKIRFEVSTT